MKPCEFIGIKEFKSDWGWYLIRTTIGGFLIGTLVLISYFLTMNNLYGNILERQGVELEAIDKLDSDLDNYGYKVFIDNPELLEVVQKIYGGKDGE
jgi:hypothetical protein